MDDASTIPIHVLKRFTIKQFDYVIVYPSWDKGETRRHELLHAKYHMDEGYRKMVEKTWNRLNAFEQQKMQKRLKALGYPEAVHLDEWQAHGLMPR
jgi:hypothetical protein